MSNLQDSYIHSLSKLIFEDNLVDFIDLTSELYNESSFDIAYVFQKVYLYACINKKIRFVEWLEKVGYTYLTPIQSISIRHLFKYGNFLLKK